MRKKVGNQIWKALIGHVTEDYLNLGGGIGAHYDYGMLEMSGEAFFSRWEHPVYDNLDAYSAYLDARYKLAPQWYLAGRVETIRFSKYDFGSGNGQTRLGLPIESLGVRHWSHVDEAVTLKVSNSNSPVE